MRNAFPKFIIEDGKLIISKCTYHKQLACDTRKVVGGGWFIFDLVKRMFIFDGNSTSEDFGSVSFEQIKKCVDDGEVYTNSSARMSVRHKFSFSYKKDNNIIEI